MRYSIRLPLIFKMCGSAEAPLIVPIAIVGIEEVKIIRM